MNLNDVIDIIDICEMEFIDIFVSMNDNNGEYELVIEGDGYLIIWFG